ncbi:MAG: hypothetical protein OXU69_07175 [Gemmatimonadota bacterium]|nr:hypothetical protein [Gemmatimonadota bacterium]MDE2984472.1 hypothetical protein [Gemmatimonadota bacterium]
MKKMLSRRLLPGLGLVIAVAACEDETEPGNELTVEESIALVKGVGALLADTTIIPIHVSEDSIVVACPAGGRAKLVGAVIEEPGDTAVLGLDYLITPTGCVVTGDALEFTLGGDPALRYQLRVEIVGLLEHFDVSGMITGGLSWQLEDRSGGCEIALTLAAVPDLATQTLVGTYSGTLCGHEVEIDAADLLVVDL